MRSKGDKATYIGHELQRCRDYSSLHYRLPFEKVGDISLSIRRLGEKTFVQRSSRATSLTGTLKKLYGMVCSPRKFLRWVGFYPQITILSDT